MWEVRKRGFGPLLDCLIVNGLELLPIEEMVARLERVLAASPADATELVWVEIGRTEAASGRRRAASSPRRERTVLVRVAERGRVGLHATEADRVGEIDSAVRQALGRARVDPPPAVLPRLADGLREAAAAPPGSFDPELARLTGADASFRLQQAGARDERLRLAWAEARVAVVNSRGLRRAAEVTAATLTVRSGRGVVAGRAAGSARSLAALGIESIAERARARRADGPPASAPAADGDGADAAPVGAALGATAVVLAPEATVRLLDLLGVHALSARSFRDGTSFLVASLGERIFDPAIHLRDDGSDPAGLPLPFDLFGFAKRPMSLVDEGVVLTPAVDDDLAAALNRPPTAHAVGGDDSRPAHLVLLPGSRTEAELCAASGDGLWIGWLHPVEVYDPRRLRFRARARGVRRLVGGAPGPPLGDLLWDDSVPRLLARVSGLGSEFVCLATGDGVLGGTSAPALALPAAEGLRPAG